MTRFLKRKTGSSKQRGKAFPVGGSKKSNNRKLIVSDSSKKKIKEHTFNFDYPLSKTVSRMEKQGFFVVNPEEDNFMFDELSDAQKMIDSGKGSKIWTVIEEDGSMYLVERKQFVNRLYYYVEAPMSKEKREYLLSRKGFKKKRSYLGRPVRSKFPEIDIQESMEGEKGFDIYVDDIAITKHPYRTKALAEAQLPRITKKYTQK